MPQFLSWLDEISDRILQRWKNILEAHSDGEEWNIDREIIYNYYINIDENHRLNDEFIFNFIYDLRINRELKTLNLIDLETGGTIDIWIFKTFMEIFIEHFLP